MRGHTFEEEVHRVAQALWNPTKASPNSFVGIREVDGMYETEEMVHIIECTTRTDKQKATDDGRKLLETVKRLETSRPRKAVKGWFVTSQPPTPDQRLEIEKHGRRFEAISFADFQSKLIEARAYIAARSEAPFGSARDLETNSTSAEAYVPLDIQDARSDDLLGVHEIARSLQKGDRFVLFGDFGAGKSMTLRETFMTLARAHRDKEDARFPIHINLRDHKGQDSAEEALLRHADRCGFSKKHQLVRAWRAGYAYVILDGFDEMSSFAWQGDFRHVVALRRKALQLVRQFMQETPVGAGVIVAGRASYFDSLREAEDALEASTARHLTLNDFSDAQIRTYLAAHDWTDPVPEWVPARPLLLGILATRNLLHTLLGMGGEGDIAGAWDHVLNEVFQREAAQQATLNGGAIRRIVERLAAVTRGRADGVGPLYPEDVSRAFTSAMGYPPDDEAMQVLLRLPLLGNRDEAEGSRQFVDADLVDILRVGPTVEFVHDPFIIPEDLDPESWTAGLGERAVEVLEHRLRSDGIVDAQLLVAMQSAHQKSLYAFGVDILRILLAVPGVSTGPDRPIQLSDQEIPELELAADTGDFSNITLRDCIIRILNIENIDAQKAPRFRDCIILRMVGPSSARDLPVDVFADCEIGEYAPRTVTTQGIMELPLALGARVMLTVLKKIFAQSGRARVDSALRRGLDQSAQRLVTPVLGLLISNGVIIEGRASGRKVWLPARDKVPEVRKILANPSPQNHQLLSSAEALRA